MSNPRSVLSTAMLMGSGSLTFSESQPLRPCDYETGEPRAYPMYYAPKGSAEKLRKAEEKRARKAAKRTKDSL